MPQEWADTHRCALLLALPFLFSLCAPARFSSRVLLALRPERPCMVFLSRCLLPTMIQSEMMTGGCCSPDAETEALIQGSTYGAIDSSEEHYVVRAHTPLPADFPSQRPAHIRPRCPFHRVRSLCLPVTSPPDLIVPGRQHLSAAAPRGWDEV